MKFVFNILIVLTILGCSKESNENEIIDEKIPEATNILTVTTSSKLSNTPFSKPREAIVL